MSNFETNEQKAGYGVGLQIGTQLMQQGLTDLEPSALEQGVRDVLAGNEPQLSHQEIEVALAALNEVAQQKREELQQQLIATESAFLEENAKREEVTVTDSGLQYEVMTQGEGAKPAATDKVRVHYHGSLLDGTVFDSSVTRGQPAEFPVNGVIAGWIEALQLMNTGSKWKLYIPHELAYGPQGAGSAIPPFSALMFEVELLDIL
ncbi:FKBP-type peptidyl-prolyl cis-trans isomerase [Dongshaea marina]|uniref:FKBP-type peptidyl-prolyl cis-trans isomerase n=1 Tax=Dongshaea marina TaxID=2047966 RepID=UPI000D3E8A60|nr:FKBP-type peptidyl-prolyl cis-trans isomerase [Dongshaea marina]